MRPETPQAWRRLRYIRRSERLYRGDIDTPKTEIGPVCCFVRRAVSILGG
jgi:hypothetical protein